MKQEDDKLKTIIGLIKRSEPKMKDKARIADEVIREIASQGKHPDIIESLSEYLFGWVNIGWVRRSLITVSLAVVFFFGYQQTVLIKRVNELSTRQVMPSVTNSAPGISTNYSGKIRLYRLFGGKAFEKGSAIPEDQIEDFVRSVYKLNSEYRELLEQMRKDTALKKYVGEKIEKMNREKSKI